MELQQLGTLPTGFEILETLELEDNCFRRLLSSELYIIYLKYTLLLT